MAEPTKEELLKEIAIIRDALYNGFVYCDTTLSTTGVDDLADSLYAADVSAQRLHDLVTGRG